MSPMWGVLNLLLVTYCKGEDPMKQKSLYAYCDQYLPHCYYSDGNPIDVMSTTEADNFCKSINEKGRLLDFALGGEINKVKMFLANYSLNKVLLNAKIENGRWKWIQQGNDIMKNSNLITKGEQLFYILQPDNSENFYVVCKTECKPNWTMNEKVSSESGNTLKFVVADMNSCQDMCDANLTCDGIDWDPDGNKNCGLLMKADSEYIENLHITHYTIDRSVKTIANCIGLIKVKGPEKSQTPESSNQLFVTKTIIEQSNRSWSTKQSFPFQIEPAQLVLTTLLPTHASSVAPNPANASPSYIKPNYLDQPYVTYVVSAFVAALVVLLVCGIMKRRGAGEDSDEDEDDE